MKKIVKLAAVREALDAYDRGEVSYSRMVQMINEQANKELEKLERAKSEPCGLLHSTDWNGKCFRCGEQIFVREPK
jgi:uncharacterized paraquat-inducible protein A